METQLKRTILQNKDICNWLKEIKISDIDILNAENQLGIQFSEEYKSYLKTFGCLDYLSHEWTGLEIGGYLNVIEATKQWDDVYNLIQKGLFVIEGTNIDGVIICSDNAGIIYQISSSGQIILEDTLWKYFMKTAVLTDVEIWGNHYGN